LHHFEGLCSASKMTLGRRVENESAFMKHEKFLLYQSTAQM
jgi:hypothetical protein